MGLYSPSFFAARVSKPLESFSVSSLCSEVIAWARARRVGGMDSSDAAFVLLATCHKCILTLLTRALQTNTTPKQQSTYTRKAAPTYPGRCNHSRGHAKYLNCDEILKVSTRIPIGSERIARDAVSHARKGHTALTTFRMHIVRALPETSWTLIGGRCTLSRGTYRARSALQAASTISGDNRRT